MSFDWSDYLNVARELAGHPNVEPGEEARFRSAISRAYYTALCCARNHLIHKEARRDLESDVHRTSPARTGLRST